jgi:predicted nucleotidyltransferase
MNGGDRSQLQTAVSRLVQTGLPEEIVLFGSRVRGDARDDSDYDLMIVEAEPFGPGRSRLAEIARLERSLGELPIAVDILLYSRREVAQFRNSLNHVVGRALREGEVLYVRP